MLVRQASNPVARRRVNEGARSLARLQGIDGVDDAVVALLLALIALPLAEG